jgi:hypothetical protein
MIPNCESIAPRLRPRKCIRTGAAFEYHDTAGMTGRLFAGFQHSDDLPAIAKAAGNPQLTTVTTTPGALLRDIQKTYPYQVTANDATTKLNLIHLPYSRFTCVRQHGGGRRRGHTMSRLKPPQPAAADPPV